MQWVYRVRCEVHPEKAQAWETFFLEEHLQDVLDTGFFAGYSFRRETEVLADGFIGFVSEYYYDSAEQFAGYQAGPAADRKKDVLDRFAGAFRCERSQEQIKSQKI